MDSEQFELDNPTISKNKVYWILREHDIELSEFLIDFHVQQEYDTSQVLAWLGY